MSRATSPSTNRPFGVARVTRVWQVPRSTVYAQRDRRDTPTSPRKHGPKTAWTDEALTAAIRTITAASPFRGEGHRKIWARLRVAGVRTSKRRVLRLLRVADLLGPARVPVSVEAHPHDGTINPDAPNRMWGTDATLTVTLTDGQVTIFGAIDHDTAECVGLHAAKPGTRFEALEPIRHGVRAHFGGMAPQAASGLALGAVLGVEFPAYDHERRVHVVQHEPVVDESASADNIAFVVKTARSCRNIRWRQPCCSCSCRTRSTTRTHTA